MKLSEMRDKLKAMGYSDTDLEKMNKKQMETALAAGSTVLAVEKVPSNEITSIIGDEKQAEVVEAAISNEAASEAPTIGDVGWSDYVLSQLTDDEKFNDKPRVDGLRRIATKIFGMYSTDTFVVQCPQSDNAFRGATTVKVATRDGISSTGSCDIFTGNCSKPYSLHAIATSESISEGRALKRLLRLKGLTAEEAQSVDVDEPNGSDGRIPAGMKNSLLIMADRTNVDLLKTAIYCGMSVSVIDDLTQQQGLELSNRLSEFARAKDKIPNEVRK